MLYFKVREFVKMADILSSDNAHLPLAEIMLMLGFFIIYFIEELVDYMCVENTDAPESLDVKPENINCLEIQQNPRTYER